MLEDKLKSLKKELDKVLHVTMSFLCIFFVYFHTNTVLGEAEGLRANLMNLL